MDDDGILKFLANNDINVFNYGYMENPGFSSAPDYALSVKRPMAVTNTQLLRHVANEYNTLEKNNLKEKKSRL